MRILTLGLLAAFLAVHPSAFAEGELDTGDTAWMLTSTALVLFMTLPGLALFYGGLVRSKNALSVLMQCFALACLMSLLWLVCGYGIAFGDGGEMNKYFGLGNVMLADVAKGSMSGTIPESIFVMFQMTFAVITPALIVGGFAERMRFSAVLLFSTIWLILVYAPVSQRHVVRWHCGGWKSFSITEHHCCDDCSHSGINVDNCTTSKI